MEEGKNGLLENNTSRFSDKGSSHTGFPPLKLEPLPNECEAKAVVGFSVQGA